MGAYSDLCKTLTTSALLHLIETRGTVSPEHKDVIAAELESRGVTFNRPPRPTITA